ncbi:MAG: diaminopimelate decarboxylase [Paludibacteraceae bacterium]|nr:diaminopimelate decarboxylase [Paludibacteraceae bacterium]
MNTKGNFPIDKLKKVQTPFYYYDVELLNKTLDMLMSEANKYGFCPHYAMKANANAKVTALIAKKGLGADCVSGNEVSAAIAAGFPADKIVFAGVGKTDKEINTALDANIFCFNAESIPELEVINELAAAKGKVASVELRINPNVDAHTHAYITTGLNENKFGFSMDDLEKVINLIKGLKNIKLIGLHFHIGSQITDLGCFVPLCERINALQDQVEAMGVKLENINVGGGLGIDYENPNTNPIPDFKTYFSQFAQHLKLRNGQKLHCEPGRSVVAQCGSLITKVTYVKKGKEKQFAIVDGGMTDLIRPALYQAYHKIEAITTDSAVETYDVVGPICESSDVFQKDCKLNGVKRGDLLALRSAGAYGEIMASRYNLRELPVGYLSTEL